MQEKFPSNSLKSKMESAPKKDKKEIKQVVTGDVGTRKVPLSKRFKNSFLGDNLTVIKEYILKDVIGPAIQDTIFNILTQGGEMLIYRDTSPRRRGQRRGRNGEGSTSTFRYDKIGTGLINTRTETKASRLRESSDVIEELIFESRADAEIVLDTLRMVIEEYQWASVQDLYSAAGKTPNRLWTDTSWGWDNLSSARVERVRGGGYALDLPNPKPYN